MDKPFAISLEIGSSLANKTGSWRVERPVYVDRLPPCNDACPAGENIQRWLYHAESGDYEAAWRTLVVDNPMPAIMGRVCYRPCETPCNRAKIDEAVGINAIERFLGDLAIERSWDIPTINATSTHKRVLVVGAGPAGLSAAYHLRRAGHAVSIYEAGAAAGGMMRYGIPRYRLPREVLDAEVQRILDLGVDLTLNQPVEDLATALNEGEFDAAILAVGAQVAKHADIPAGDSARILDAVSLLRSMEGEDRPYLGRRIVVYGGGDTALDAARTAKRLGATDTLIVYRRTREQMPADPAEVEEAAEEGILMKWLSTIAAVGDGKLVIEEMQLDADGFPQPTGRFEELPADSLVLALGQDTDLTLVKDMSDIKVVQGSVVVGDDMMTGHPGVYAAGDAVDEARTVTTAIGQGKRVARSIGAWLEGGTWQPGPRHELATFEDLNPWYYSDAPKNLRPRLDLARRISTFDEIEGGLDEQHALFEARRCLSCGNCFECDNCFGVCPDNAVIKLGGAERYEFNYDFCKGCGICVKECPCGAIVMEPEEI
jgi:NADPH-dependent glutamate synthase beta subunit-like oxidoreductase